MGMEKQEMEQRVSLIRRQMTEAALQAGRRPEEILLLAASKTQDAQTVALSAGLEIELAQEINRQAVKRELVQDILIEVNLAGEQSKSGVAPQGLEALMEQVCRLPSLRVRGLMAIPPAAQQEGQNKPYFSALRQLFVDIKSKKYDNANMDCLSMGMSRDFRDAIAEGATLVRIGSGIYGPRS